MTSTESVFVATEFTPMAAAIGGVLIGLASALLLVFYGKIAGLSGLIKSMFAPAVSDKGEQESSQSLSLTSWLKSENSWKVTFLLGLLLAGFAVKVFAPELLVGELSIPTWLIVVSGLLVGLGTSIGNGCTSGHGVCGMSRFSVRSWVATIVFMGVAVITANVMGI